MLLFWSMKLHTICVSISHINKTDFQAIIIIIIVVVIIAIIINQEEKTSWLMIWNILCVCVRMHTYMCV